MTLYEYIRWTTVISSLLLPLCLLPTSLVFEISISSAMALLCQQA